MRKYKSEVVIAEDIIWSLKYFVCRITRKINHVTTVRR